MERKSQDKEEIDIMTYGKNFDEAVKLYEKELSVQNIADFYQMSRQAMWMILKRRGCKFMTYSEAGRLGGIARARKYGSPMKNKETARKSNTSEKGKLGAMKRKIWENVNNQGLNSELAKIARKELSKAIKRGIIKKQPCEGCGSTIKVGGHHKDYGKPLDVNWLCPKHHGSLHFS